MKKTRANFLYKIFREGITPDRFIQFVLLLAVLVLGWTVFDQSNDIRSVYRELGDIYAADGRPNEAAALFKESGLNGLEMKKAYLMQLIQANRLNEAHARMDELFAAGDPDAELHYISAVLHYRSGELEEALELANKSVSMSPLSSENAYDLIGTLYLEKGDLQAALNSFQKGLLIDSEDARLHNGLGVAYLRLGQTSSAEAEFRRALEIDPFHENAKSNLENITQE